MSVTADSTLWTADTHCVTADGKIICSYVAPAPFDDADGFHAPAVAGGEQPPTEVAGGGGYYLPSPRPFPVEGEGFGILPKIEGDAHGGVVVVGAGVGPLPGLTGEASGSVGVAGRSVAQIVRIRAAAVGNSGQAGAATAILKCLSVASSGAVGTYGAGMATLELKGAAVGRHDDDEAAVMTFLLAA